MANSSLRQGSRLVPFLVALASLSAAVFSSPVVAQGTYPTKSIRFIVTVLPGGGSDILARMVGGKLNQHFGQAVIVENITGASGLLAYQTIKE